MKLTQSSGRRLCAALLFAVGALTASHLHAAKPATKPAAGGGGSAGTTVYSGQAVALRIDGVTYPTPGQIVVCDTGALPPTGGALEAIQSNVNIASGALTIDHASAFTTGSGPRADASSTLSGYHVEFVTADGDHTHRAVIEADFIHAEVDATVERSGRIALGSQVIIQGLKVNGQVITVTGQPNQRVELPPEVGGWLILNEQVNVGGSDSGDIAVSAIHFFVCHCIEGHVGLVRAGITSSGTPPPSVEECGKVTGGGWILGTPSGAKGTFGMSGGIRRGEFWGHLTFQDHGANMKVQSTDVIDFEVDSSNAKARIITYAVTVNGAAATAVLRVVDNGEPGRNDLFELSLSTGYTAAGELGGSRPGGGNIQLHKCPPGWR